VVLVLLQAVRFAGSAAGVSMPHHKSCRGVAVS
jgi:hypothetical protein